MGQAAGPASSALSVASAGFSAFGSVESGMGTMEGDNYRAAMLDRAAQYGELKATQTGGQMTRDLAQTLGNIDAVRAAARGDPASPSDAAARNQVESIGVENKNISVDSLLAQSQEDEANAAYLRSAGNQALLSGEIGAGADILKGLAGAMGG